MDTGGGGKFWKKMDVYSGFSLFRSALSIKFEIVNNLSIFCKTNSWVMVEFYFKLIDFIQPISDL